MEGKQYLTDSKKKILIISYYFPPYNCIGSVRIGRTAETLVEQGYNVQVATVHDPFLDKSLKTTFPKESIFYYKSLDIDHIISLFFTRKSIGESKKKVGEGKRLLFTLLYKMFLLISSFPDRKIGWLLKSYNNILKNAKEFNPDLILSTSPPETSHLIARLLSKKLKKPWIADLRDLWSDSPFVTFKWIKKRIENKTLSKADCIITVSKGLKETLSNKYNDKVKIIYNGYDKKDFKQSRKTTQNKAKDLIKIVFSGTYYPQNYNPTPIFKAIAEIPQLKSRVRLKFIGPNNSYLKTVIAKYAIKDVVSLQGKIKRPAILKIMQNADVLLMLKWDDPRYKGLISGKIFEYIGARKPILMIGKTREEKDSIILDNSFGIVTSDINQISHFLLNIHKFNYDYSKTSKFSREYQIIKLDHIIDKLIKQTYT